MTSARRHRRGLGVLRLLGDAARGWREHRTGLMAPGLAFYSLLSSAPLLLLAVGVARRMLRDDAVRARVLTGLDSVASGPAVDALTTFLRDARLDPGAWTAGVVGVLVLVYAASRLFVVLRGALHVVFELPPPETRREAWIDTLRHQGFAVAMVAAALALWFAGLLVSVGLEAAEAFLEERVHDVVRLAGVLSLAYSVALPTLACALVFRATPGLGVRGVDAWIGGLFTGVLLTAGQEALGVLVARWAIPDVFGAAGSLVLVLLWYQAMWALFLFGAEFTRALGASRSEAAS